jgi:hypothetical protein
MNVQVTKTGSHFRPAAPRNCLAPVRLLLFALVFLTVACGSEGGSGREESARAIFERAQALHEDGQQIEALKEFDRLAEFPETGAYLEAKQALLAQGVSIGSGLESWTIQRMFDVKNDLIRKGRDRHPDGDVTLPLPEKDAWGNAIWVRYSNDPNYTFLLVSNGKDGQIQTEDDLVLTNRRTFDGVKAPGAANPSGIYAPDDGASAPPLRPNPSANVYAPDEVKPVPPAEKPAPEAGSAPEPESNAPVTEQSVDLNDLLEQ